MRERDIDAIVNPYSLRIEFKDKPPIVGASAMECDGIRKRGDDIDRAVPSVEYRALRRAYPDARKDIRGDPGVSAEGSELFRMDAEEKRAADAAASKGVILNGDYDDDLST